MFSRQSISKMEAFSMQKKKSLGSYVWKSILKARRVISLGARQRVGDRKSRSVQRKLDVGKL